MARSYKFSVVQFRAHPLREERLNIAIAVFRDDGLDIFLGRKIDKLRAISAAIDLPEVERSVHALVEIDAFVRSTGVQSLDQRLRELSSLGSFDLSALGEFLAPDRRAYEHRIDELTRTLIEPEPAPAPEVRKRPSRLRRTLKEALRHERILARRGEGLEMHRVVTNQRIAEGLTADFLLQNGAMHVIETVDAGEDEAPIRRVITEVAVSALVFEGARMAFRDNETLARLVYRASSTIENALAPSLKAAEHQGAQLINWASADDQRKLLAELSKLADPAQPRHRRSATVHASTQTRFNLN